MNNEQLIEKLNNSLQQRKNAYDIDCFQTAKTIANVEGKELKSYVSIEKQDVGFLTILIEYETEGIPQGCEIIVDKQALFQFINEQVKDMSASLEIFNNPIEIETKRQYIKDFINQHY